MSTAEPIADLEQQAHNTRNGASQAAEKWTVELQELEPWLRKTTLQQGWANAEDPWAELRVEWERIRRIKTDVVWLATDASKRVERKLLEVGALIDEGNKRNLSAAALGLSQAEGLIQRAWLSRWYNRWHWRMPPVPAAWPLLTILFACALGVATYFILDRDLHPRTEPMNPSDAFYASVLWGLMGGIILALKTLKDRVQDQVFEIVRVAWYLLSPLLGGMFGAIAYLLFLAGLLTAGQGDLAGQDSLAFDPTPILLLALLAGLAQNTFIHFVTARAGRMFSVESEEEEGEGDPVAQRAQQALQREASGEA